MTHIPQSRPEWLALLQEYHRYFIISATLLLFYWIVTRPLPQGLTPEGLKAIAIFALCVIFWVTNVIPLMITSLLAIILFPLLGVLGAKETYSLFGNQAVFFILGAFILASSLIRSGLSSRLALFILNRFGKSPKSLLLSILLFPAFLSFWMSEHAVAAMIFPIVLEIADSLDLKAESKYGTSLFLAMSWGCIIGGAATFLGGARVPLAIGMLSETTGQTISFLKWMAAAFPLVIFLLIASYFILCKLFPPDIDNITVAKKLLAQKLEKMGKPSRQEKSLGVLMVITILFWIFAGHKLELANIALAAVIIAFVFNLMKWKEVEEDVNWGIFLMYGGAISLGFAMEKTHAAAWVAGHCLNNLCSSVYLLLSVLAFFSIVLTEAMSNSAVVALLMPMSLGLAKSLQIDPKVVTMAVTIPSGLGFTLPMGAPAMAIAFSSGYVKIRDCVRGGIMLNILSWVLVTLLMIYYWPLLGFSVR